MINILYEDNHLLIVEKPINMPVCKDSSEDLDLLNYLKQYLKNKYNKPGNAYLGLVHRLDRPVGGIMIFAKTSKAASRLSEQIKTNKIKKTYYAVMCGKIESKGKFIDKLLKDTATNTVTVNEMGKESILEYELIKYCDNYSLVKINLITGRSHQIRVQFSSRNYPLYGDQKYNKKAIKNTQIALFANEISFYHPITNDYITFKIELPNMKPWNLFK